MEAIQHLNWRYATKKYNGSQIDTDNLNTILESIRLTPTSLGMQPFKVLVIDNPELREKMLPIAYNQSQIKDASHIILFAANTQISEENINSYMDNVATTRQMPVENLAGFKGMINGFIGSKNETQITEWACKQCYIALGVAMATAAALKVDTTPMEGYKADEMDILFDLKAQGFTSAVLLAVGHRDAENDQLAKLAKVRRSSEEMFEFI
jgi:nitroreductase/dihydropteridine reductase